MQATFPIVLTVSSMILTLSLEVAGLSTNKFGSKQSYAGSLSASEQATDAARLAVISSFCKPIYATSVIRHGTRAPGKGDLTNLQNVLNKFQNNLDPGTEALLQSVYAKFPMSQANQLMPAGVAELKGIGSRFAARFPQLFANFTNSSSSVAFFSSSSDRALGSAYAFQTGFYAAHNSTNVTVSVRDDLLRFFDLCSKYTNLEASTVNTPQSEYGQFQQLYFPTIERDVLNRLQLTILDMTPDELTSMYQFAGIEFASFNSTYWAQLFNDTDLDLLEYSADLDTYWKLGYGYPINYQQSCPLLSNMFQQMDNIVAIASINSSSNATNNFTNAFNNTKGTFYFGHAETVVPLITLLGLFQDLQPLEANNYQQETYRLFRANKISPFATNLGFALYDCDVAHISQNNTVLSLYDIFPENPTRFMIQMLFKEGPIKFPLTNKYMSSYSTVRQRYSSFIDGCNFAATCSSATSHTSGISVLVFFILFLIPY